MLRHTSLVSLLPALALALVLLALPVRSGAADVLPDGKKNAAVHNHLSGTENFPDHTFLLVTLNAMDRERVLVRASGLSGRLNVPRGYQDEPMLVALTVDQLLAFARLALALPQFASQQAELATKSDDELRAWITDVEIREEQAAALRAFVERDDVAKSPEFAFRTFVDQSDPVEVIERHYRVTAIDGGRITLAEEKEQRTDDSGNPVGAPMGEMTLLIAIVGGAVLALLALFALRRRDSSRSVPDDAI